MQEQEHLKVFISLKSDSSNIKQSNIWGIAFSNDMDTSCLYIEPNNKNPDNKEYFNESYLLNLDKVDNNIKGYLDDVEFNVNIFTDTQEKIIQKVKSYFSDLYDKYKKPIKIVVESAFDWALFTSYCFDFDNDGYLVFYENISIYPIILESLYILDSEEFMNSYITSRDKFLDKLEKSYLEQDEKDSNSDRMNYLIFIKLKTLHMSYYMKEFYKSVIDDDNT